MNEPRPERDALVQQYNHLSTELRTQAHQLNQLRESIRASLALFHASLRCQLQRRPRPPSSYYWHAFNPYWQSFALFEEKLAAVIEKLALLYELPELPPRPPVTAALNDWAEVVEELEEAYDPRHTRRAERDLLLQVVDLLDSTERLSELRIPSAPDGGRAFVDRLHALKRYVAGFRLSVETEHIKGYLSCIQPMAGQYPTPETTRIVARQDEHTDDQVIIVKVVTTGYRWKNELLRKADVIVATAPYRSSN